jgi:hypothetical protein
VLILVISLVLVFIGDVPSLFIYRLCLLVVCLRAVSSVLWCTSYGWWASVCCGHAVSVLGALLSCVDGTTKITHFIITQQDAPHPP